MELYGPVPPLDTIKDLDSLIAWIKLASTTEAVAAGCVAFLEAVWAMQKGYQADYHFGSAATIIPNGVQGYAFMMRCPADVVEVLFPWDGDKYKRVAGYIIARPHPVRNGVPYITWSEHG